MNERLGVRAETTRRGLLTDNMKAIAVIAAGAAMTAATARLTPARAQAGGNGGNGNGNSGGNNNGGKGQNKCFLKGTKIQTVEGERRVEDLAIGDLLPTVFGGVRPIQWIVRFQRTKVDAGKGWQNDARPIRIMKSALAPNVPHSDLFVTAGHALLLDGVLVTAGSLINGTAIARYAAEEYEELEFFQIKLETHDAIFAEGAACESLLRIDESEAQNAHCAPIYGNGALSEIKWRAHSALSRWIGPHKVDIIRERLGERSLMAAA
jgi:hypothetical protein